MNVKVKQISDNINGNPSVPSNSQSEQKSKKLTIDSLKKILVRKLWVLNYHNYNVNNIKLITKITRQKLGLQKSPKKKGYDKFFTDEEKRYRYR